MVSLKNYYGRRPGTLPCCGVFTLKSTAESAWRLYAKLDGSRRGKEALYPSRDKKTTRVPWWGGGGEPALWSRFDIRLGGRKQRRANLVHEKATIYTYTRLPFGGWSFHDWLAHAGMPQAKGINRHTAVMIYHGLRTTHHQLDILEHITKSGRISYPM